MAPKSARETHSVSTIETPGHTPQAMKIDDRSQPLAIDNIYKSQWEIAKLEKELSLAKRVSHPMVATKDHVYQN